MTGTLLGASAGAAGAVGLLLVVLAWGRTRRPTPAMRVDPYLADLVPTSPRATSALGAVYGPWLRAAAELVGRLTGGAASVERRLVRLGTPYGVDAFRVQQLVWGGVGFGVAASACVLVWSARGGSPLVLLVLCGVGLVAGVLGRDTWLTAQVRRHEQRLAEEFPVVADLMALAVAAGESPVAGLERVLRVLHGSLADELAVVLADVRTGRTVPAAFDALAARTGVPSIARFAEGLAVAVDRGTPLVDVLHAQAADVRESARRELMESGGRKEILMMIPVVFLVLPVTVVFAFYPGLVGLRLSS
jgi:tight adherence protein C